MFFVWRKHRESWNVTILRYAPSLFAPPPDLHSIVEVCRLTTRHQLGALANMLHPSPK